MPLVQFLRRQVGGRIRRGTQMCLTGEFARDLMFLLFVALFASNGGDRWSSTAAAAPDPYKRKGRHARSAPGAPLFVSGQTRI